VGLEWLDLDRLGEAAFFPRVLAGRLGPAEAGETVYLGDSV
jgi:hypothetical protein